MRRRRGRRRHRPARGATFRAVASAPVTCAPPGGERLERLDLLGGGGQPRAGDQHLLAARRAGGVVAARCQRRSDGATASGRRARATGSIDHGRACSAPVGTRTSGASPSVERAEQERVELAGDRVATSPLAAAAREPAGAVAEATAGSIRNDSTSRLVSARVRRSFAQPRAPVERRVTAERVVHPSADEDQTSGHVLVRARGSTAPRPASAAPSLPRLADAAPRPPCPGGAAACAAAPGATPPGCSLACVSSSGSGRPRAATRRAQR